jgi:uncharacterized membrane protein (DUF485 family)
VRNSAILPLVCYLALAALAHHFILAPALGDELGAGVTLVVSLFAIDWITR